VPRDGYQGWTRAKETAWTRVFGEPELAPEMETALNEIFFAKCDPPCDDCKCHER
jgi:hypothetical protein